MGAASAELDVRASKRFDLQSFSVAGDLSQFLNDNPTFLDGNRLDQSLEVEVTGNVGDRVTVDLFMDDSGFNDEERRMRVDVAGRVYDLTFGRIPVTLPGSRFLMGQKTGMGASLTADYGRGLLEAIVSRPEGRTHRVSFTGRGALQEYVLTDSSGAPNPLVVVGSERVLLDGVRLVRGVDYEIDYVEGAVLLSRELLPLTERQRLSVEFEEAGNGSGFPSTVLGARYTHRFGISEEARERNQLSVGYVVEVDDQSAPATHETSGMTPQRLGVLEVAGRADVVRGLAVRGRAAMSVRDEDRWSDDGHLGRNGAYDAGVHVSRGRLDVDVSRSVVEPGFQGVGLERFQVAGEGREAARDAAVNTAELLWSAGRSLDLRALFREAVTNLDHDPEEAEERVRESRVDADLARLWGGELAVRYLGESARSRAAGSGSFHQGGRDRLTLIRDRTVGAVAVQLRGEVEASRVDPLEPGEAGVPGGAPPGENHALVAFEVAGPPGKRVGWSAGGQVREVTRGRDWEAERVIRDVKAGVLADVGDELSLGLDFRHRKELDADPGPQEPERQEANTGEARVRWSRGDRWDVESHFSAEVRSRVLLDPSSPQLDPLRNPDLPDRGLNTPQTAVTENPVLNQGADHSVVFRPDRRVEVSVGYSARWEKDSVTGEAFSRDQSRDARLVWEPSERLRATWEAGDGEGFNRPSDTERTSGFRRVEVVRRFGERTSLGLTREADRLEETGALQREEDRRKDRLGLERRVRRNLVARTGVSRTLEEVGGRTEAVGADASVEWTKAERGQRVLMGMELSDVEGENSRGEELDGTRHRWFLEAGSRLGEDGFLDLRVATSAVGPDSRGGEGYRGTTTNLSMGVEF